MTDRSTLSGDGASQSGNPPKPSKAKGHADPQLSETQGRSSGEAASPSTSSARPQSSTSPQAPKNKLPSPASISQALPTVHSSHDYHDSTTFGSFHSAASSRDSVLGPQQPRTNAGVATATSYRRTSQQLPPVPSPLSQEFGKASHRRKSSSANSGLPNPPRIGVEMYGAPRGADSDGSFRMGSPLSSSEQPLRSVPYGYDNSPGGSRRNSHLEHGAFSSLHPAAAMALARDDEVSPGSTTFTNDAQRPLATYYLPVKSPVVGAFTRSGSTPAPEAAPPSSFAASPHLADLAQGNDAGSPQGGVRREQSPFSNSRRSSWGGVNAPPPMSGSEMRKVARLAAGGWGAAARTPKSSGLEGMVPPSAGKAGAAQRRKLYGPKVGAGRAAWGAGAGGHPGLGAGGYESDDGVDLDAPGQADGKRRSTWFGLRHRGNRNSSDPESTHGQALEQGGAALPMLANQELRNDSSAPLPMPLAPFSRSQGGSFSGSSYDNGVGGNVGESTSQLSTVGKEKGDIRAGPFGDDQHSGSYGPDRAAPLNWVQRALLPILSLMGMGAVVDGRRGRWNKFKWALFWGNVVLTLYSITGLVAALLAYANVFDRSRVVTTVDRIEMQLGIAGLVLSLFNAFVGWSGVLLNNRMFLSFYALLHWPSLALIVAPAYVSYKKRHFNLEGKTNFLWSRTLTTAERRLMQDEFDCCGYQNPFIAAAADGVRCFARSTRPGCKADLFRFQQRALEYIYSAAFSAAAAQLVIIVITMLCANHITYRFGKGLTPKAYRLDERALMIIKDQKLRNPSPSGLGSPHHLREPMHEASLLTTDTQTYLLARQQEFGRSEHDSFRRESKRSSSNGDLANMSASDENSTSHTAPLVTEHQHF